MATGSSGISTPALAMVYWEVTHGTSANTNFSLRSGIATLDADGRTGTFTVPTRNDGTYTGDKTFSVDIYKDSTKAVLLASSVTVTIKEVSPAPTAAPTAAPTEAPPVITNFVAKANSVGYELSFNTTLVGTTLYVTADRSSTGGTDNDYVGTVTPTSSTVTLSGSSVKYSAGQVVAIKTVGYDGTTIEQTSAIAMAEPAVPTVTGFGIFAEYYYHPDKIVAGLMGATNNSFRGILRLYGSQGKGDSVMQFDRWANITTLDVVARTGVTTNQTAIPPGSLSDFMAVFDNSYPYARLGTSMADYPINWELYAGSNIDEVRSYNSSSGQYEWNPAKKVASTSYYQTQPDGEYTNPGGDGS